MDWELEDDVEIEPEGKSKVRNDAEAPVTGEQSGQRLDVFVAALLEGATR